MEGSGMKIKRGYECLVSCETRLGKGASNSSRRFDDRGGCGGCGGAVQWSWIVFPAKLSGSLVSSLVVLTSNSHIVPFRWGEEVQVFPADAGSGWGHGSPGCMTELGASEQVLLYGHVSAATVDMPSSRYPSWPCPSRALNCPRHPRCNVLKEAYVHANTSNVQISAISDPAQPSLGLFHSLASMDVRVMSGRFHLAAKKRVPFQRGYKKHNSQFFANIWISFA
ncbi:predicted protein [Botrytis cinerea T4]|uniref:Uncharacterized protein n=1 Tax=Botryotinia fuckeliana (strain T4) TaxID=999810 RepID=G2Y0E9_BOTF4|nr:predicted protein [Botrytis cinerea T4]